MGAKNFDPALRKLCRETEGVNMDLPSVIVIGLTVVFLFFKEGQAMLGWNSQQSNGPRPSNQSRSPLLAPGHSEL